MIRLSRYLRPFTLLIVLSVALLFTQAMADLSLPDYLSRIVNNGIQQNGVENPVPQAIRQSEMNKVTLFMSDADKKTVLQQYTLVKQGSTDYDKYVKDYPTLAKEPIYVLNSDLSTADLDTLKPIIGKALIAVSGIEQAIADPSKAAALGQSGFDLSKLPAGTDVFTMLSIVPAQTRTSILDSMNKRFEAMGASMIDQAAVGAVKTEYIALGVDTESLQTNYIIRTGVVMLLISLLSGACTILVGYLSAKAAAGMARNLRRDILPRSPVFRTVSSTSSRFRRSLPVRPTT